MIHLFFLHLCRCQLLDSPFIQYTPHTFIHIWGSLPGAKWLMILLLTSVFGSARGVFAEVRKGKEAFLLFQTQNMINLISVWLLWQKYQTWREHLSIWLHNSEDFSLLLQQVQKMPLREKLMVCCEGMTMLSCSPCSVLPRRPSQLFCPSGEFPGKGKSVGSHS